VTADARVLDFARLGARRAARAYGRLLGRELQPGEPEPVAVEHPGEGVAGVVFELRGDVGGLVALLLPEPARRHLLDSLCPGSDSGSDRAASALREAGNIVASQAVSALADHLGARIAISVPTLVADHADAVLARMVARRGGVAAESELGDAEGHGAARLVFAPDLSS
jgi:chemotaxis protein CheY-P-specific phosphatase CheC